MSSRRRVGALAAGLLGLCLAASVANARSPAPLPYLVRDGDTLIGIGKALLVEPGTWREVARFNRIQVPDRIPVGVVLLIPTELLRSEIATATVVQSVGDVRGNDGQPLKTGATLPEGAQISTGENGYVTLRLADGTLLRVQAATRAQIEAARRYQKLDAVDSAVRVDSGRVEAEVTPVRGGKPRFEVRTPQGVLGVRGTELRVAADRQASETRSEVLSGAIEVGDSAQSRVVTAGFGTVIDRTGRVAEPVALLPALDLAKLPILQERVLLRFAVPPQAGAAAFRGQVARDQTFQEIVGEHLSKSPELRFGGMPDGEYFLRVRAIDAIGLEGRSAQIAFRLKARPEAPLPSRPAPKSKMSAPRVEFAWTENPHAATYHLQIARDEAFAQIARDVAGLRGAGVALTDLAPGAYFWRLASVRGDNDRGPWGDPLPFELRALPADAEAPAVSERGVRLAWRGEPGQVFDLQIARDGDFRDLLLERRLTEPGVELPRPAPGRYFVRYRAIDPDGFVGPYSGVQRFELVNCVLDAARACVRTSFGLLLSP